LLLVTAGRADQPRRVDRIETFLGRFLDVARVSLGGRVRTLPLIQGEETEMKGKLATVGALAGVLVAGSAAALVNAQVLRRPSPSIEAFAPAVDDGVDATDQPVDAADEPTTEPAGATASTDEPTDITGAPTNTAAVATQAIYEIEDAGEVTLDAAGDRLTVISSEPNVGWAVGKITQDSPQALYLEFVSPTERVSFRATLVYGVVSTSVEEAPVVPPSAGRAADDTDDATEDDHGDDSEHESDREHKSDSDHESDSEHPSGDHESDGDHDDD
jgi:hypothetical protein